MPDLPLAQWRLPTGSAESVSDAGSRHEPAFPPRDIGCSLRAAPPVPNAGRAGPVPRLSRFRARASRFRHRRRFRRRTTPVPAARRPARGLRPRAVADVGRAPPAPGTAAASDGALRHRQLDRPQPVPARAARHGVATAAALSLPLQRRPFRPDGA